MSQPSGRPPAESQPSRGTSDVIQNSSGTPAAISDGLLRQRVTGQ